MSLYRRALFYSLLSMINIDYILQWSWWIDVINKTRGVWQLKDWQDQQAEYIKYTIFPFNCWFTYWCEFFSKKYTYFTPSFKTSKLHCFFFNLQQTTSSLLFIFRLYKDTFWIKNNFLVDLENIVFHLQNFILNLNTKVMIIRINNTNVPKKLSWKEARDRELVNELAGYPF